MKHDLQCTQILPTESRSLLAEMGMSSSSNMFRILEENNVSDPTPICSVYAYADAPDHPAPLSRSLIICGVADSTISLVRKIMSDDGLPDGLCKSTIAVQLADERHFSRLEPRHQKNSTIFATFMKRLRQEDSVAVISKDKYNRFGLLVPMTKENRDAKSIDSEDCAAFLYTSTLEDVREALGGAPDKEVKAAGQSADESLWQPPGGESTEGAEALWRPPGTEDEAVANATSNSWQPPGSDNSNPWNAGETGGAIEIWGPESDQHTSGIKRGYGEISNEKDEDVKENGFHVDTGAAAADAFYSGLTRNLDTRADSRLYHMRSFNGWVKATQISELNPRIAINGTVQPMRPLRVLDLACGKGGDLTKWSLHQRGMSTYCGIDVARGSLKDAAIRIREMRKRNKLQNTETTLICADLGADVPGRKKASTHRKMQKLLAWSLQEESEFESNPPEFKMVRGGGITEQKFDVVSIQFAIHYMMSTGRRARRFFHTVSELLDIGGNLICTTIDARVVVGHLMNLGLDYHFDRDDEINTGTVVQAGAGACRITFEPEIVKRIIKSHSSNSDEDLFGLQYTFTLVEGSDHGAGVGDAVNLPEWLTPIPVLESLGKEAGLELEYAENFHEFYENRNEEPSARNALYNMRVLNRNGTITEEEWSICRLYAAIRFRKVRESTINLNEEEETNHDDSDEEEEVKIDPIEEKKKLPMAMMKAKKAAGEGKWKGLSSEEKKRLTQIELKKLLKLKI